ncbi:hypothetical protein PRIPAC_77099 [Pristionchus pacificus]|nr:hypothetical protein PRIPAC_77099 [Pristionchus pacificus]
MPKYFGGRYCDGSEEGVLILEDFSDRMISEIDFLEGFSIELVKDIIQSIVGYQNVYMNAVEKFPVPDKKVIFGTLRKIAETSIDALSVKSWITEEAKKQLYHIAKNVDKVQVQLPEYAKNCPRTLIHSDLWPNNMLYERNGDDNRLLSIIDWQCYTIGRECSSVSSTSIVKRKPNIRCSHPLFYYSHS